jgi:hypothetical protein
MSIPVDKRDELKLDCDLSKSRGKAQAISIGADIEPKKLDETRTNK